MTKKLTVNPIFPKRRETPRLEKLFYALCEHPYGLTNAELCDIVYGGDADGGPDKANEVLNVLVSNFNRYARKDKLGLRIRGTGGPGSRYLIWVVRG